MDCPRCRMNSLVETDYEGRRVQLCGTCWGAWMRLEQLQDIVDEAPSRFSRAERRTVADTVERAGDLDRTGSEQTEAPCPECGVTMQRRSYADDCPIVIDECPGHGVWLDAGELKELQVLHG